MPELLVFVPCEKVIISGEEGGDGSTSLISVLQAIGAEVPIDQKLNAKPRVAALLGWSIFTLWKTPSDEIGIEYRQQHELLSPGGEKLMESTTSFKVSKEYQRVVVKVTGMPVSEAGEYRLGLRLIDASSGITCKEASFPIMVAHTPGAK